MRNLLHANLYRLGRSLLFWGLLLFNGVYAVIDARIGGIPQFLSFTTSTGLVSAVLISFYIGADYSDGTIRNKLASGHRRGDVYLANLLAVLPAVLALNAVFLGGALLAGSSRMDFSALSLELVLSMLVASVGMTAAYCAVFTCVSTVCTRKAVAVLICAVGVLFLSQMSVGIDSALSIPEYYMIPVMMESGAEEYVWTPHPLYVSGVQRTVYQFLLDILPNGQAVQFQRIRPVGELWKLTGYSAALTAGVTSLGLLLFRRKDLK